MLFGERFCRIKLLFKILSLVSVAKEKFPNFAVEGFKSNEICDATKDLPERYKKHSKHLPSTQKCHHITKVVGYFLTKTCPCHHQIEQNQEKKKSDAVAQTVDTEESISSTEVNSIKLDTALYMEKVGKLFSFSLQCALKITLRNISSHSWSISGKAMISLMIPIKHRWDKRCPWSSSFPKSYS